MSFNLQYFAGKRPLLPYAPSGSQSVGHRCEITRSIASKSLGILCWCRLRGMRHLWLKEGKSTTDFRSARGPRLWGPDLRQGPDEGWRRLPIQDRIHIVEGEHAHRCPSLDRGAADMRQ